MEPVVAFLAGLTFWHWFALGGVLLILEILTPTFYLMWPGIAALVVGLVKLAIPDLPWQMALTIFGVMSVVATIVWQSLYKRGRESDNAGDINQRTRRYVGRRAVVAEGFRGGRGPILLDDTRWQAISEGGGDLGAGSAVEITGSDGVTLRVRPAG